MKTVIIVLATSLIVASCGGSGQTKRNNQNEISMVTDSLKQYGYNRDFLKKYVKIIELKNARSTITVVPAWQGRVMTSSSEGDKGFSFGWINHELIASTAVQPHINAYGGEERLWIGPEGGQFSIFFGKGKTFTYNDWQTPAFLDTRPFELISSTDTSVLLRSDVEIENYSGTLFDLRIERAVTLLSEKDILKQTDIDVKGLKYVAYRSDNTIFNRGNKPWKKETGQLSIWMLGMFNPSPSVLIVIPVKPGEDYLLGPKVNDNYFGKISEDRLKVSGNHIFFRADGKSRGKIGIPPLRAKGIMGSYDSENKILTLVICKLPEGITDYVNSAWQIQDNPYSGDAINAYNDGPLEDGTQMGPFYELETSSPAANLSPRESLSHIQYTLHLTGDINMLDNVSRKILGVSLEEINKAF